MTETLDGTKMADCAEIWWSVAGRKLMIVQCIGERLKCLSMVGLNRIADICFSIMPITVRDTVISRNDLLWGKLPFEGRNEDEYPRYVDV